MLRLVFIAAMPIASAANTMSPEIQKIIQGNVYNFSILCY